VNILFEDKLACYWKSWRQVCDKSSVIAWCFVKLYVNCGLIFETCLGTQHVLNCVFCPKRILFIFVEHEENFVLSNLAGWVCANFPCYTDIFECRQLCFTQLILTEPCYYWMCLIHGHDQGHLLYVSITTWPNKAYLVRSDP
jgi:hypothetical protein